MGTEQLRDIQWFKYRNDNGTTAPAGAILRITGYNNDAEEPFFIVDQPDTFGSQYNHAVNDDNDVASGGYGYCCLGQMVPALYDSADGTPAFGELWGPRSGSWKLKKNTGGFQIKCNTFVGGATDYRTLVTPAPFLRFRGVLNDPLDQGQAGDCSIFIRSSRTGYIDTTVDVDVLNDLDINLDAGAVCECEFEPDGSTVRWRIVNAAFTCSPP